MKINRLLSAALIILATVFTSCVKESVWDVKTGIDPSKAAPEGFTFDVAMSSNTTLAVFWDGQKAKAAGAQSFFVQLTEAENMDKGNSWDSKFTKVLEITDNPEDNYESVIFNELVEGSKYYVRIRANYRGSVYSEWAYIAAPTGEPLLCEVGTGPVNPAAAAPESLTYNAEKSDETTLTFDAVATAAKDAGATGLLYRLVNYETGLSVSQETEVTVLTATFAELGLKSQHKAKVAAVYGTPEEGIYVSNWVSAFATITKEDGTEVKTTLFEPGIGAIEDKGVRPRIRCNLATSSTLHVEWSSSAFANTEADFNDEYNVQLYKDAECKDLLVSWVVFGARGDKSTTQRYTPEGSGPRFMFSGLDANTSYYAIVTNNTSGMSSSIVEMKTAEFTPVTISETPAVAGDVVLAEDFSEFVWGGDFLYRYPGYSAKNRDKVSTLWNATGVNPLGQTEADFYFVDAGTEMGLFNTLKNAVPNSRLANWGMMTEAPSPGGHICARAGHMKLGASSYIGRIVTPALSSLTGPATVEVSFKCAVYENDETTGGIWVITADQPANHYILEASGAEVEAYKYPLAADKWETVTTELKNVGPDSRLMFGNIRTSGTVAGSDQQRMYIDDIVVKVVSYEEVGELLPPTHTSITLTAEEGQVTATWNPVGPAAGYVLAYKKASDSDEAWTEVEIAKKETSYTITGLLPLTTYEVKVKSLGYEADVESAWSSVVSATTPASRPVVTLTPLGNNINVVWAECPGAVKYVVMWKKAADAEWQSYETTETAYTIVGLAPQTQYEVKVAASFNGAEGVSDVVTTTTEATLFPLTVNSAEEWANFISIAESALETDVVTLGADLDFTGVEYTSIPVFNGIVDGNNKTIKNLKTSVPLFKTVNQVKNLTFDSSCALTSTVEGKFAMLAEVSTGLISNVTNNANVTVELATAPGTSDALIAAGIVAEAEADIQGCTNNGNVTINSAAGLETSLAGGICGYASTKVSGCTNNGKVSQNSTHYIVAAWMTYKGVERVPQHTGGIVAMTKTGSVLENCTNTGNVVLNMSEIDKIGKSAGTNRIRIGGIAGAALSTINGCTNKGLVECYARTSTRGSQKTLANKNYTVAPGGITGGAHDYGSAKDLGLIVENCTNEGNIIVDADVDGNNSTVGGIVSHPGWESSSNTNAIRNCINRGNITVTGAGKFRVGGINGGLITVVGCENYGTIKLATNAEGANAGSTVSGISGFVGQGLKFENNKNFGDVIEDAANEHHVAGLIGGVNKNTATYGVGCVVNCNLTTKNSVAKAGMVLGYEKTDGARNYGTAESPIKVSGTFNGTPIDATNVLATSKGSSSEGTMNVVFGE